MSVQTGRCTRTGREKEKLENVQEEEVRGKKYEEQKHRLWGRKNYGKLA